MKKLLTILFFYLLLQNSYSQDLLYTFQENCDRVGGHSFRVCGIANLYTNGLFRCNVKTSSNHDLYGFTGTIEWVILDKNNTPIFAIYSNPYGVNRNSSRIDLFEYNIPGYMMKYLRANGFKYQVNPLHTPKDIIGAFWTQYGKKIVNDWLASKGMPQAK